MNPQTSKEITGQTSSSEVDGTSPSTFDTMRHEQAITIQTTSDHDPLKYLSGNREDYLNLAVPLYQAALGGDWETAKSIFDKRPDLVRYDLSKNGGTTLHVAATAEETKYTLHFVKNVVNMMTSEELELKNKLGNTAFHVACVFGNTIMAKIMMEKNNTLPYIRDSYEDLPLYASALAGKYSSVKYLYCDFHKMTDDHWTDNDKKLTLLKCLENGFFDIAFQIVKDHPELALDVGSLLSVLARKPEGFIRVEKNLSMRIIKSTFRFFRMKVQPAAEEDTYALKLLEAIWGHATRTMNFNDIKVMLGSHHMLFDAAVAGNIRFIVELLRTYPDLMLDQDGKGRTIFHIAVMYRHLDIYNLLYEIGDSRKNICISEDWQKRNNMLHLVACRPESSSRFMSAKTSGPSLLMQPELLWFKEVYDMVPPYLRERKNTVGLTPYELFSRVNAEQLSNGLQWMKDCMVVATLIITVAFAVAFTVPGGYNQDHGLPLFIHRPDFLVFVIADAISLFSSSTSLLVFLSILTSGYEQLDFLFSLPRKLLAGLLSLFISVAAMMVTFSASFFVMYHNGLKWVPILIAAFATIPIVVFAIMQFHILVDMFRSTFDSRYLFNPRKRLLYPPKQRLRSNNSPYWRFSYKSIIKSIFSKRS